MKTKRLLVFLLCLVMLFASAAVVISAAGSGTGAPALEPAVSEETMNSDGTVTTKYGKIPSTYADAQKYPFITFKFIGGNLNGSVEGWPTMAKAFDIAKVHQDKNKPNYNYTDKVYDGANYRTTVVLMRRDYTTKSGGLVTGTAYSYDNCGGDQYDNYAQLMGEVTLDLNGYTLTQGKDTNGLFYQVTNKAWGLPESNIDDFKDKEKTSPRGVFRTEYTIINGNIRVDTSPVFYGNMWNCTYYDQEGNSTSTIYSYDSNTGIGAQVETPTLLETPYTTTVDGQTHTYLYKDKSGNYIDAYNRVGSEPNYTYYKITEVNSSSAQLSNKDFYWNFDNVNFGYVQGATYSTGNHGNHNMLMGYCGIQGGGVTPPKVEAPYYFNYTNCSFDLTNAPNGEIKLFNAFPGADSNNYNWLKITVNVENYDIIAPLSKLDSLKLYNVAPNGSSVAFKNNPDKVTLAFGDGQSPKGDLATAINACSKVTLEGEQAYWTVDGVKYALDLTISNNYHPIVPTENDFVYLGVKKLYWHISDGKYVLSECVVNNGTNHACTCGLIYTDCTDGDHDNVCDECAAVNLDGVWFSDEDIHKYPFVVVNDGTYVGKYTTWLDAVWATREKSNPTLHMLRNYKIGAYGTDRVDLRSYSGEITVNLHGFTMLRGVGSDYVFDNFMEENTNPNAFTVNVENGTIIAEHELICLSGNENIAYPKTINFNFTDVTFKRSTNTQYDGWIIAAHKREYNKTITSNIVLTNCIFDMTSTSTSVVMDSSSAFNLDTNNASGKDYIKTNITFRGGAIYANEMTDAGFVQVDTEDEFIFEAYNGQYTTLTLPAGACPETPFVEDKFTKDSGARNAYYHIVDKANNVYTVSNCSATIKNHICSCGYALTTCYHDGNNKDAVCDYCKEAYGYLITEYGISIDRISELNKNLMNIEKYPFFVLKKQVNDAGDAVYTLESASETLYGRNGYIYHDREGAIQKAIYSILKPDNKYVSDGPGAGHYVPQTNGGKVSNVVIVTRRDYTINWDRYSEFGEYFDNIAHAQGEITIDINRKTLTATTGSHGFFATIKGWTDSGEDVTNFASTYTFRNGNIITHSKAFAAVNSRDDVAADKGALIENSILNLNYENVKFSLLAANGSTTSSLAIAAGTNSTINECDSVAKLNVNYNSCVFDFQSVVPNKNIAIVSNNQTGKDIDCDVNFEGCTIIATDISKITVYETDGAQTSTVNVDRNDITLKMPEGSLAPANTQAVILADGQVCSFKKTSNADGYDIYTLAPTVTVDYKIKTNVTLHTNFVYNIYIPSEKVIDFTVTYGGKTYTKSGTTEKNGYYVVNIELPIAETLSDIAVEVTLNSGSTTTANLSYTLGILKYAESILAGSYLEMSKTLVKDMLVYAYNAHKYFGVNSSDIAANLAKVEGMLSTYYRRLPTDVAVNTVSDTYFESVTLDLGRKPAYRFYLNNEYAINDFTFTIGGTEVNAIPGTEDEKSYIEIKVPAYDMLGGVSYTVTDKTTKIAVTETYNVVAYYNGIIADKPAVGSGDFVDYAERVSLVESLMKYSASAEEYKSYIGNDGFGSMKLVVPATIYANHVGSDVTALFTNGAYYGNVTWTANNPNVYVVDGKIYAVGTFEKDTEVKITATTEHHSAEATVTVKNYTANDAHGIPGATLPNPSMQAGGKTITAANGNALINNYIVTGKLDIYKLSSIARPHIQFKLADEYRFLILDNDTDHIFGAGYQAGGNNYVHDTTAGEEYDARSGNLTLDWAVMVDNNVAYFYVNGVLKQTMTAPTGGFTYLHIGGLYMDMYFSDIKVYTKDNVGYTDRAQLLHHNYTDSTTNIRSTGVYVNSDGNITTKDTDKPLTDNYIVKGTLTIYSGNLILPEVAGTNDPHLQFHLGSRLRFLIWDNDRDGWYGNGYEQAKLDGTDAGTHYSDVELGEVYDGTNGTITFEWAVIVVGNTAYFYVDDVCVATIEETSSKTFTHFNIGALAMSAVVYDIEVVTKANDSAAFNTALETYGIK